MEYEASAAHGGGTGGTIAAAGVAGGVVKSSLLPWLANRAIKTTFSSIESLELPGTNAWLRERSSIEYTSGWPIPTRQWEGRDAQVEAGIALLPAQCTDGFLTGLHMHVGAGMAAAMPVDWLVVGSDGIPHGLAAIRGALRDRFNVLVPVGIPAQARIGADYDGSIPARAAS